jgi:hypothetical protein
MSFLRFLGFSIKDDIYEIILNPSKITRILKESEIFIFLKISSFSCKKNRKENNLVFFYVEKFVKINPS